jgi:hypothetical protein
MWNRNRDLPACIIVPQPTTLPRVHFFSLTKENLDKLFMLDLVLKFHGAVSIDSCSQSADNSYRLYQPLKGQVCVIILPIH